MLLDDKNSGMQRNGSNTAIGSVLVVGGGIAGMQTSLDLADAGYKVHLVEKKSAIGGHFTTPGRGGKASQY